MSNEIKQNIESLGLKTSYNFKQIHIPTSGSIEDKHQKLREIVAPAIRDLESKSLINGFYHIIHQDLDLRLSCDDWEQYESEIKEVLAKHSIASELEPGGNLGSESYGGPGGALLTENNLEINSRLTLAIIELIYSTDDETTRQGLLKQCPHQWVHHLCNQFGLNNFQESEFDFNNAMAWLETIIYNNRNNPQAISDARGMINTFKDRIAHFESTLLSDSE